MDDGIDADEIEETAAEKEAKRAAADKEQHDILVRAASDQIVQGTTSADKEPDSDEPDSDEPVTTKTGGDAPDTTSDIKTEVSDAVKAEISTHIAAEETADEEVEMEEVD